MKSILKQINLPLLVMGVFIILVILFDLSQTVSVPYPNYCFILVFLVSIPNIIHLKADKYLIYNALFALWCGATLLWTINFAYSIERFQTVVSLFFLCIAIASFSKYDKKSTDILLLFFLIGGIILLFWSFFSLQAYSISVLRTSERLETGMMDENFLGKILALSSIVCLYYLVRSKKKTAFILLYLVYIYMGLVLKSKSALLAMVFGGAFYMYIYFKGANKIKYFYFIIAAIVSSFIFLSYRGFFGDAFIRITNMFDMLVSGDASADMSTFERAHLIQLGWEYFTQNPIFGFGIGTCKALTGGTYFHNNYVQLLAETGLPGFLLYYLGIGWLIKKIWPYKYTYEGALYFSFIITMLIGDTNNSTHYQKLTWIIFGLCYLWIVSKNKQNEIEKQ